MSKTPLTPSAVNNYIKNKLEGDTSLKKLYVAGEASNVKYHSNGNIYFNIKDQGAQINCIMFKNYVSSMDFKMVEGDQIEILGNIYTYVKMGQFSINVFKIRKMGQGDLFAKYLELKNSLEKEGYFKGEFKKEIPKFPKSIGVITSDTGAAIRDIITTIKRRYPIAKVKVIPTLVQGINAYKDITSSIEFAQSYDFDVLIVGRGGGSIEDLWAFNEREVAEAIFKSEIPIISAVGHETDFTISDFVADKRAPTPTAAAEIATPNIIELIDAINKNINIMKYNISSQIKLNQEKLNNIKNNQYFINPLLNILTDFSFLQDNFLHLTRNFKNDIISKQSMLETLKESNVSNINNLINKNILELNHQKENLDNLNPLTILSKGYSTIKKDNQFIKSVLDVKVGDDLTINLEDGNIKAKVLEVEENDE